MNVFAEIIVEWYMNDQVFYLIEERSHDAFSFFSFRNSIELNWKKF